MNDLITLEVKNEWVVATKYYCKSTFKRNKNWAAIVKENPASTYGADYSFLKLSADSNYLFKSILVKPGDKLRMVFLSLSNSGKAHDDSIDQTFEVIERDNSKLVLKLISRKY